MRRLADRLGIKAPSLYKHLRGKQALEAALISDAFLEAAERFEQAADAPELGAAYRAFALEHPHLYRLMFQGRLPRERLAPGRRGARRRARHRRGRRRPRPRAGALRVRPRHGHPRARRPLPARRRPRRRVGARAQRVCAYVAPPRCSTIRLESTITSRPSSSTGTWRWPVRSSISSRSRARQATRSVSNSTSCVRQLARHPPARAQPVRRRAAAVQPRGHGTSSPSRRTAKPAARQPSGCRVPIRAQPPALALAVPGDRRLDRLLVRPRRPAELAPRLASSGRSTSARRCAPRPA